MSKQVLGPTLRKRSMLVNVESQDLLVSVGQYMAIDRDMQKVLIRCCQLMPWLDPKRVTLLVSTVRLSDLSLMFNLLHVRDHRKSKTYLYRTVDMLRGERIDARLLFCDDFGSLFGGTAPPRFTVTFSGPGL